MRQRSRTTWRAVHALLTAVALIAALAVHPGHTARDLSHADTATSDGTCPDGPRPDADGGLRPPCTDGHTEPRPATLTRGIYTPDTVPCRVRGAELPVTSRPTPAIQPRPA